MATNENLTAVKYGLAIPLIVFLAFLVYWFGFRDSWEIDNYSSIIEKAEAVISAVAKSDDDKAERTFLAFKEYIENRNIKQDFIIEKVKAANDSFLPVKERLKQAAIESRREKKRIKTTELAGQQGLIEPPSVVDDQTVRTVALSDSIAPYHESGLNLHPNFVSFSLPVLNNVGQVAFCAFRGNDQTAEGIWSEGGGNGLALMASSLEHEAPGTSGRLYYAFGNPIINDKGLVAFLGYLTNQSEGIWSEKSGNVLALVARGGIQAPGFPAGVTLGHISRLDFNSQSQIVFGAFTSEAESGIWADRDGGNVPSLIARSGDQAPGTDRRVSFSEVSDPTINDSGQIAFLGHLTDVSNGIWSEGEGEGEGNRLTLVTRTGHLAPDANNGVTFFSFDNLVLNNRGRVAFRGYLTGNKVSDSNEQGIWSERGNGKLALVACAGNHAPGTDRGVFFSEFLSLFSYRDFPLPLNGDGQTAFVASLDGKGVDHANDHGVWSEGSGKGLFLIARSGIHAPGTDKGVNFSRFRHVVLNEVGQIAFLGGLIGKEVDESNNWGIWVASPSGVLTLIHREGDQLDVDDGKSIDSRMISSMSFAGGASSGSGFNDIGQLAFVAEFTDGSSAIVVSKRAARVNISAEKK